MGRYMSFFTEEDEAPKEKEAEKTPAPKQDDADDAIEDIDSDEDEDSDDDSGETPIDDFDLDDDEMDDLEDDEMGDMEGGERFGGSPPMDPSMRMIGEEPFASEGEEYPGESFAGEEQEEFPPMDEPEFGGRRARMNSMPPREMQPQFGESTMRKRYRSLFEDKASVDKGGKVGAGIPSKMPQGIKGNLKSQGQAEYKGTFKKASESKVGSGISGRLFKKGSKFENPKGFNLKNSSIGSGVGKKVSKSIK